MAGGYDLNPLSWGVDPAAEGYLLEACENLGWSMSSGLGPAPLTWTEIKAYADATGDLTEPWEFQVVRDMSGAYIAGYHDERGIDPAMWTCYTGYLRPLVAPADATEAKLVAQSVES